MIEKMNRYLNVVLILTLVCSGVLLWVLTQRKPNVSPIVPRELAEEKVPPPLEDAMAPRSAQSQSFKELVKIVFTAEELASPENQKLMQAIESPQFQEFLNTHPRSVGEYFDFFQAQGVPVDKNELFATFDNQFQKQFSEETPTELEPYMRELLSIFFRESNIDLGTQAGIKSFQQIIIEFLSDEQTAAWVNSHFRGDYNAFGQWAVEIFQNPTPILSTESPIVETDEVPIPGQLNLPDVVSEGPIAPENKEHLPRKKLLSTEEIKPLTQGGVNIETELGQSLILNLSEHLESLTNETFESNLRERFSPEHFNRTLETLNQHGPEEGLRRLKRSDPEIAIWIEDFLQKQQETD